MKVVKDLGDVYNIPLNSTLEFLIIFLICQEIQTKKEKEIC